MSRYKSYYVLLFASHTIWTRLLIMINGIGRKEKHQLIELKIVLPKQSTEQNCTRS